MNYKAHDVIWTDEKVAQFWEYENNGRKNQENWFTLQLNDAIWNFTKKYIYKKAKILDYGAGKGFLSEYISNRLGEGHIDCADFSEAGLENIRSLLSGRSNFGDCILIKTFPIGAPDDFYDVIYFIETIEHLTDNFFHPTIEELKRLLKPGGILIITTPNNEDLSKSTDRCPDCGCVFHRVQHIQSFTCDKLKNMFERIAFTTVFCKAVNLTGFKDKLRLLRKISNIFRHVILKRPYPNLVYIGKK
jgi:SAM-dependent methyltransferase